MLKKLVLTTALLAATVAVTFAQGTIQFATRVAGTTAQVRTDAAGPNAGALATGTLYVAQLWAAPGTVTDDSALSPVGSPVFFRAGGFAGYSQESGTGPSGTAVNPVVTVATPTPGGPVTVQLRAWSAAATSYAAAAAPLSLFEAGKSALLTIATTGGFVPPGGTPALPATLTGLQGFNLIFNVPEPTTLALAGLGLLGALFIRRRK